MEKKAPRIKKFAAAKQRRLDELLEKNSEGAITAAEKKKLETLVREAEQLMVENARRLTGLSADGPSGAVPVTVWVRPEPSEQS
ncbi:MAG: hypothetical protein KY475_21305 [Planctomycetes bacterium]|nr:hypothetical protein [Planctomycetota bacterium]